MKQKLFTFLLALVASVGTMFAETYSGTCGENLTWDLTEGVLTINGAGDMTNWAFLSFAPWYSYKESIISVTIGNKVTSIGDYAFISCNNLTSITIPNSLKSIGMFAFSSCNNLTSITIPDSVKTIGTHAFEECYYLTSVTIPSSVKSIGKYAFYECYSLTSVTLNSGNIVGKGYTYTFSIKDIFGTQVQEYIIGNSVTCIGTAAFYKCSLLTSITIPNSVTSIGEAAFEYCAGIRSVTIGNSVATIEDNAFHGCGLNSLTCLAANPPSIQSKTFNGINKSACVLYVPNESLIFYKNTSRWKDFLNIKSIVYTITFVDDNDTILSSQEVDYNAMPIPPADPVKQGDAQYSFTFAGWTPEIAPAIEDATYKATYTQTTNKYTITFLNDDNSVLSSKLWDYGSTPSCEQPTKAEDEEYTYTFKGWVPEIVPVVADATYIATYEATHKPEGIEDVLGDLIQSPTKVMENSTIYILMPNGKKYSIIGNQIR